MRAFFILALAVLAVSATPKQPRAGWTETTIDEFPELAAVLYGYPPEVPFQQHCVGTILNNRSILTSAECIDDRSTYNMRVRLGSSYAHSGGDVYNVALLLVHPNFDSTYSVYYDIGIIRLTTEIKFGIAFPGNYPPFHYEVPDNDPLYAVGWGAEYDSETGVVEYYEQMRKVEGNKINLDKCRDIYQEQGYSIPDHKMCFADFDNERCQCPQDYGSPLFHYMADGRRVVVGVYSWGGDGREGIPSVNGRVTHFMDWIQLNV